MDRTRIRHWLALALAGVFTARCAAAPADSAPPSADAGPDGWHLYRDAPLGFSVRYPPHVVLLTEGQPLPERRPPLLRRIRFLDGELARNDTASIEPPTLAIEIFADAGLALARWLEAYGRGESQGTLERLEVHGAIEAMRVRQRGLSAPDAFLYYRARQAVVLLVPLGTDGEAMARTFDWER